LSSVPAAVFTERGELKGDSNDGTYKHEFNQAKGKMADDLKIIVSDGEELLKAAAHASGGSFTAARAKFAGRANEYVRGSPWTVIGVAAAAGMLIGFLAA